MTYSHGDHVAAYDCVTQKWIEGRVSLGVFPVPRHYGIALVAVLITTEGRTRVHLMIPEFVRPVTKKKIKKSSS